MKHPRNKGDRIYYKKARINKLKKERPIFIRSNYWPVYAKNRGQNWKTRPIVETDIKNILSGFLPVKFVRIKDLN